MEHEVSDVVYLNVVETVEKKIQNSDKPNSVYYDIYFSMGRGICRTTGGKRPPLGVQPFVIQPKSTTDNTAKPVYMPPEID